MRALLVGNYGVGNLGDEVLREYFLQTFPDVSWTVVSARPKSSNEVPRLPFGIRSLLRPWWRTIGAIGRSDALVYGGGSLFTDIESVRAPMMWWMYAAVARLFGVPVHAAFQGVGPFRTSLGASLARSVLRKAKSISVRDEASLRRVQEWNTHASPFLTFDPAFVLFSRAHKQPAGRRLLVLPRANATDTFLRAAQKTLEGEWDDIVILLMQSTAADREHAERLKTTTKHVTVTIVSPKTMQEFLQHISHASFVLSQRFHGALAALAIGIPYEAVSQEKGDKLDSLSSLLERDALLRRIEAGEEALREFLG